MTDRIFHIGVIDSDSGVGIRQLKHIVIKRAFSMVILETEVKQQRLAAAYSCVILNLLVNGPGFLLLTIKTINGVMMPTFLSR